MIKASSALGTSAVKVVFFACAMSMARPSRAEGNFTDLPNELVQRSRTVQVLPRWFLSSSCLGCLCLSWVRFHDCHVHLLMISETND